MVFVLSRKYPLPLKHNIHEVCSNHREWDGASGANVCDASSDVTHDLQRRPTPTNLSNKFSESTTTITTEGKQDGSQSQQKFSRTASEEDLSDSRQTGVSSAENSFASAARGLGEYRGQSVNKQIRTSGRYCCYNATIFFKKSLMICNTIEKASQL